jgi:post-segregation antitoxin (ccd killing protein)
MVTVLFRDGVQYSQTTVAIPTVLKNQARERGMSMSAILAKALEEQITRLGENV